jgi:hypothetical protein
VYTTSSERKVVLHRGDNPEPEILDRLMLHTAEEMAWTNQKVVGDSDAVDDDDLRTMASPDISLVSPTLKAGSLSRCWLR